MSPMSLSLSTSSPVAVLPAVMPPAFDAFNVSRTFYNSTNDFPIPTDIFVPVSRKSKCTPMPVMVRIHGGFLATSSSIYADWFYPWILDFANTEGAVIINPNYRLVPEVKAKDVLDDMDAFWKWIAAGGPQKHLDDIGRTDVKLNMDQLLLQGDSAGGYLAIQSVLSRYVKPKSMVVAYPMLDLASEYYNTAFEKPVFGFPNLSTEIVDQYINAENKTVITEDNPPTRVTLAVSMVQNGRVLELMGNETEILPLERVRTGALPSRPQGETILPPLFIMHGDKDVAVPTNSTTTFLDYLKAADPESKVHLAIRPGDHGFDATATLEESWLKEGLDFVKASWLKK